MPDTTSKRLKVASDTFNRATNGIDNKLPGVENTAQRNGMFIAEYMAEDISRLAEDGSEESMAEFLARYRVFRSSTLSLS